MLPLPTCSLMPPHLQTNQEAAQIQSHVDEEEGRSRHLSAINPTQVGHDGVDAYRHEAQPPTVQVIQVYNPRRHVEHEQHHINEGFRQRPPGGVEEDGAIIHGHPHHQETEGNDPGESSYSQDEGSHGATVAVSGHSEPVVICTAIESIHVGPLTVFLDVGDDTGDDHAPKQELKSSQKSQEAWPGFQVGVLQSIDLHLLSVVLCRVDAAEQRLLSWASFKQVISGALPEQRLMGVLAGSAQRFRPVLALQQWTYRRTHPGPVRKDLDPRRAGFRVALSCPFMEDAPPWLRDEGLQLVLHAAFFVIILSCVRWSAGCAACGVSILSDIIWWGCVSNPHRHWWISDGVPLTGGGPGLTVRLLSLESAAPAPHADVWFWWFIETDVIIESLWDMGREKLCREER